MSRKRHTPSDTPQGELLSAIDAADLLGIGRTRFWQLRKSSGLQRVPWSPETRPLYRRADILELASVPQGEGAAPAQVSPTGDTDERLARARAKFITSFAHLPELPDFPSDKVLLENYGG